MATIIFWYNPTHFSDETDITNIYYELSLLIRHIPKHDILIIGVYRGRTWPKILKTEKQQVSTK